VIDLAAMADDARQSGDLVDDLRRLGVRAGDVLMVHASLRAIGPVTGGADAVLDALDEAVGEDGTLLMVLGARDDWDWVNDHAESERAGLLAGAPSFDADETPSDPDVGVLAEVFRQRPGTVVNDHPDGRFGARGHGAIGLLEATPWHDYYGPRSPLDRLCQEGGKVLRLGADLDTVTLLHLAEYYAFVDNKRTVRRHHVVAAEGERAVVHVDGLDDSKGIVDWVGEDYFAVLLRAYLASDRTATGLVGGAQSELIDATDLLEFATKWMTEHLQA
jgi:aminoglycoside 3-N-acetyltransferase